MIMKSNGILWNRHLNNEKKPNQSPQVLLKQMSQYFLMRAGITNRETLLVTETHQLADRFQQVQAKTETPAPRKKKKKKD